MKTLAIAFVTARKEPEFEWFLDSLQAQCRPKQISQLIVVDSLGSIPKSLPERYTAFEKVKFTEPKPTIWQGKHRITKEDWWAKANALNTAICLCETDWIAFCDDRCVLLPSWIHAIESAMIDGTYAVTGSYEKRTHMQVSDGKIISRGILDGIDTRPQKNRPVFAYNWYGGNGALPLEWCLKVNGFSEDVCDSLGMEDVVFGGLLINNNFPIRFDSRMKIIEDRTQGHIDGALKRTDKGKSPYDKSHGILKHMDGQKTSMNSFNILDVRNAVLAGKEFPPPSASHFDWWDNQPIKEFV